MAPANEPMGRLERVDLNEAWGTEDGDFTPWLAEEKSTKKLQVEYWEALQELLQERNSKVQLTSPGARNWMTFSFKIREIRYVQFRLCSNFRVSENRVVAGLQIQGDNAEAHFYLLSEKQKELEQELDERLIYDPSPNAQYYFVAISRTVFDIKDQSIWPDLLEWHYKKLEDLHRVFAPRIKNLDASDYIPGETDLDDTEDELA